MHVELLRAFLSVAPPPSIASASDLRQHSGGASQSDTVERAAIGGSASAALGWAFASGYEAALARLVPALGKGRALAALCATEEGGGHPRAIKTTLSRDGNGWRLSGRKTWVTLGLEADALLVVASTGIEAGRNRLRVAVVPSDRAGVALAAGAPLPFAPEIGHASLELRDVAVADDDLLAGDGYDEVLKPFRTIEDVHVLAGVVGWSLAVGSRSRWDRAWRAEAAGALLALQSLGAAPPSAAETHAALAGVSSTVRRLLGTADWAATEPATRDGWLRDRPLLEVASGVRGARLEAAWRALEPDA